jgi:hypothetical protein
MNPTFMTSPRLGFRLNAAFDGPGVEHLSLFGVERAKGDGDPLRVCARTRKVPLRLARAPEGHQRRLGCLTISRTAGGEILNRNGVAE